MCHESYNAADFTGTYDIYYGPLGTTTGKDGGTLVTGLTGNTFTFPENFCQYTAFIRANKGGLGEWVKMDFLNNNSVNVAVQVLPISTTKDAYAIVDSAISVIEKSGVKYVVTPFETVMEGKYDTLMNVVKDVQNICYSAGAEKVMCYIKIQSVSGLDVTIDDKIGKYIK